MRMYGANVTYESLLNKMCVTVYGIESVRKRNGLACQII